MQWRPHPVLLWPRGGLHDRAARQAHLEGREEGPIGGARSLGRPTKVGMIQDMTPK